MEHIITGANGYIAGKLIKSLLKRGEKVIAVTHGIKFHAEIPSPLLRVFPLNNHPENLRLLYESTDKNSITYHMASQYINSHVPEDISGLIEANLKFGNYVLEYMQLAGHKKIISLSTSWVHSDFHLSEPVNLYAAHKKAFSALLEFYSGCYQLKAIELRLCDTFGPDDPRPKLLNYLLKSLKESKAIGLSPGEQEIDLLYIDEVINSIHLAASMFTDFSLPDYQIFRVSSLQPMPLKELIAMIEKVMPTALGFSIGATPYRPRTLMKIPTKDILLPDWKPVKNLEFYLQNFFSTITNHADTFPNPMKFPPSKTVSICVPCCNEPDYLFTCLKSIENQEYKDFEIIIGDNSTNLECCKIIDQFHHLDIKHHHHTTQISPAQNWNFCLDKAQGKIVKILFCDDYFSNSKSLTNLIKIISNEKPFAFCGSLNKSNQGESLHSITQDEFKKLKNPIHLFHGNIIGCPSATIFMNNKIRFDETLRWDVDWDFYIRLSQEFNNNLAYTQEPLVTIAVGRENSLTDMIEKEKITRAYEYGYMINKYFNEIKLGKNLLGAMKKYYRAIRFGQKLIRKEKLYHSQNLKINLHLMIVYILTLFVHFFKKNLHFIYTAIFSRGH